VIGPGASVHEVLAELQRKGTAATRRGMARYGIVAKRAFGVPMGTLLVLRKKLGTDQALSLALWTSGWYEARLLATMVGDSAQVTRRQMDAWARSFENWADCDTACFKLFDRVPFADEKAVQWTASTREFVKRGGFALVACLALHRKEAPDPRFKRFLPLIVKGARDPRNFVKKGVVWALRGIGNRSPALRTAALDVARRLAASPDVPSRWVGNTARRELTRRAPSRGHPA
jgi:3-methyladenine DNA glycosylase AlkD